MIYLSIAKCIIFTIPFSVPSLIALSAMVLSQKNLALLQMTNREIMIIVVRGMIPHIIDYLIEI